MRIINATLITSLLYVGTLIVLKCIIGVSAENTIDSSSSLREALSSESTTTELPSSSESSSSLILTGPSTSISTPAQSESVKTESVESSLVLDNAIDKLSYSGITPKGNARIFIQPIVNGDENDGMRGCKTVEFSSKDIIQDSILWPWSGLKKLSRMVYTEYKNQIFNSNIAWRRSKTDRIIERNTNVDLATANTCVARRMLDNRFSLSGAVCSCLSASDDDKYCSLMDLFALNVHCHDNMAKYLNHDLFCPILLTKTLGVNLSPTCSSSVLDSVASLNLELYKLNSHSSVPDQIESGIHIQEARTYHLLHKALERVTKWADAHLFCKKDYPNHPNLQDIEVLPTWNSKFYFYIDSVNSPPLPIAVLAERDPSADSTSRIVRWLILVRDLRTTFEGRLFLSNAPSRGHLAEHPGYVHEGYDLVASLLQGHLQFEAKKLLKRINSDNRVIITVSGLRNFGAGVATIIARDLAGFLQREIESSLVDINLVAFEAGPVGDYEFTENLRKNVNVRNILADKSGLTDMPCQEIRGCGKLSEVYTGAKGVRTGPFVKLPGQVLIRTNELPDLAWKTNATQLEVVANMVCAIPCWIKSKVCMDDTNPQCSFHDCNAFISDEAEATHAI